jgi:hypothetical protein
MTSLFKFVVIAFIGLLLWSCGADQKPSGKSLEEYSDASNNSSIIRNPVSANGPQDTTNVAKLKFEEDLFDFGEVKEGTQVEHVFAFANVGKVPLVINDVKSTCGCTIPEWPEDPIAPGESGEISVQFNSNGRTGEQSKPVTVFANTYPNQTQVILYGYVEPKE